MLQRRGVDPDSDDRAQPDQPVRFRGIGANVALVASLAAATYVWGTATQDRGVEVGSAVAFIVAIAVIVVVLIRKALHRL